jgi:hypothetical protein
MTLEKGPFDQLYDFASTYNCKDETKLGREKWDKDKDNKQYREVLLLWEVAI